MKARVAAQSDTSVQRFKVPQLNFDAADYTDLLNWMATSVTEPPVTVAITDVQTASIHRPVHTSRRLICEIRRYRCHQTCQVRMGQTR